METNQEKASIKMQIFGIEYKLQLEGEEIQKTEKFIDLMKTKARFKKTDIRDALRTTRIVGLDKRVSEGFEKVVKNEKLESAIYAVGSLGALVLLKNYDLPSPIEFGGYFLATWYGLESVLKYGRAHIASRFVNKALRDF